MEPKVIIIAGPTCSGKSDLALKLSDKISIEIISADSRQFYKYMDIGTAKPSSEDLLKVKHHFIDILEPDQDYNASRFEADALQIIKEILNRGNMPVVAGGSGLYIKALTDGIADSAETDENFRAELMQVKNTFGNEYIYEELKKIDPVSAAGMLPQNWKRIIRALEVFHLTGKPLGQHHAEQKREANYNFMMYGLDWERSILYSKIEKRVDEMIEKGIVQEVKKLLDMGYNKNINSLNTVGYKEIIAHMDGQYSFDKAIELIKRNTRRYAKRQLTWFRADDRIKWFKVNSKDDFDLIAKEIVEESNYH